MYQNPWTESNEKIICGPYDYLNKIPGKDIRPKLIEAFNSILKVDELRLCIINNIIGMLHTASLIIDDVEDNGSLRRGQPVAHSVFGTAQTINSSNYVMFLALQKVQQLQNLDKSKASNAVQIFTEEMLNLHRGQGLDLYWRETYHCPTEEEYTDMVMNIRLMQDASAVSGVDLVPLANILGVLYQVQDDYMNLQSQAYSENKGFCEDLTEGKFSFPIIHSIRSDPANKEMINILKQRTTDVRLKQYAVAYMKDKTKSFDYARGVVHEYKQLAVEMIEAVARNYSYDVTQLRGILDKLILIE